MKLTLSQSARTDQPAARTCPPSEAQRRSITNSMQDCPATRMNCRKDGQQQSLFEPAGSAHRAADLPDREYRGGPGDCRADGKGQRQHDGFARRPGGTASRERQHGRQNDKTTPKAGQSAGWGTPIDIIVDAASRGSRNACRTTGRIRFNMTSSGPLPARNFQHSSAPKPQERDKRKDSDKIRRSCCADKTRRQSGQEHHRSRSKQRPEQRNTRLVG